MSTQASVLQLPPAVAFDSSNPDHRKAYLDFLNTGKWSVRFSLEHPFQTIPSMIMYKLSILACAGEGTVDMSHMLAKSAILPTEKAVAVNNEQVEKAA
jgi:hypothetical protein